MALNSWERVKKYADQAGMDVKSWAEAVKAETGSDPIGDDIRDLYNLQLAGIDPANVPKGDRKGMASWVSTQSAARQAAEQDPLTSALRQRAEVEQANIDPSAYAAYGQQFGTAANAYQRDAQQMRNMAMGGLGRYDQGLSRLYDYATGARSAVDPAAQIEREQLARHMQSTLASQQGGYNPALARAAMFAQSQGLADIGAQAAAQKAEEQRAATDMYLRGLGGYLQGISGVQAADLASAGFGADMTQRRAAMTGLANATRGDLLDRAMGREGGFASGLNAAIAQQMQLSQQPAPWERYLFGGLKSATDLGALFAA